MKKFLKLIFIISLALILTGSTTKSTKKIKLQLRWNHQYQFAGYYMAKWKGYYEKEGFDVEILPGKSQLGSTEIATEEVYKGKADYGIGSTDIILQNDKIKNERKKLVLVSSVFQKSPIRYYMYSDEKYTNLADLSKLNIGMREKDLLAIELQTMLKAEGISSDKIPLKDKEYSFDLKDLSDKKYDIIPGYSGGVIDYYSNKNKIALKEIKGLDYGIDFYGDSLFTNQENINNNPKEVEKFRKASMKGWEYALEHPNETIEKIVNNLENKEHETKSEFKQYNEYQYKKVKSLTLYPIVELGNINPYRWNKMSESLNKIGFISNNDNMENYIFNYQEIKNNQRTNNLRSIITFILFIFAMSIVVFFIKLNSKKNKLEKEMEERKKTLDLLRKQKENYEILFNSSIIGIVLVDKNGNITQYNKKWRSMVGATKELLGRSIYEFIASDENNKPKKLADMLMNNEIEQYEVEQKYIREDNSTFWGNLFIVEMIDMDSEGIYLNMVADITSKKLFEKSLKMTETRFRRIINEVATEIDVDISKENDLEDRNRTLAKLEKINAELERMFKKEIEENKRKEALIIHQAKLVAMGEMIGNIAHQWRQPLNSLSLVLSNIEDEYIYNTLSKDYFCEGMEKSKKLINQMSNTIDDFRYFFNPIANEEYFKPYEVIKSVLFMIEERIKLDGIDVKILGNTKNTELYGLKSQYSQALFNIINNSVDALEEKDIETKELIITLDKEGEKVICTIEDNAGGVPEEQLKELFSMYYTTKSQKKGTGLGLYISKTIIEKSLKGSIECYNGEQGLKTIIIILEKR